MPFDSPRFSNSEIRRRRITLDFIFRRSPILLFAAVMAALSVFFVHDLPSPAWAQQALSSDATLSGLAVQDWQASEIPLRPAFSAQTAEYGVTVPLLSAGLVRLRPAANHSGATITVDGKAVASGAKSDYFSLKINTPQRIVVAVTAEDGVTRREYAVTVTKGPRAELSALSVSDGRLHPFVFSGRHTDYRAWVANSVTEVKVTPTNRYDKGTITVNGQIVASGQASQAIALAEGDNAVTVKITAPDGYTARTYGITVTRATAAASADATLSGLAVHTATSSQPDAGNEVPYEGTAYTLSPALAAGVYEYRVVVPEEVARRARESEESGYVYVTAMATTSAPGAKSIVVEGNPSLEEARHPKKEVVTGESSGPWYAFIGYSPITIEVTSLDGKNTQTYRVVVEHGSVDELSGVSLTPGDGQLTLSWGEGTGNHPPNLYWARWREAGTTTWLNSATLAGWKTGYGDGAPEATAADGERVTGNSHTISGLANGTEYEVQLRGTRHGDTSYRVTNWLKSDWVTVMGTPGQAAARTLAITPSAPSREYGGTDDLSYTVGGLDAGDAATDVVSGSLSRATGEDAGSYAISMGTLAIASAYAGKYALPTSPAIASYTITPRPITAVSGVTVNTRPADGSTTASFDTNNAQGVGVLTAELADFRSGGLQVSGSFPAATPGTHDVSVTYSLGDNGTFKAGNYTLSAATDILQGQLTQAPRCACGSGLALATHGTAAEGGDPVVVIVAISRPAGPDGVEVTLITGGTATYGDDYALSPATINIAASESIGTAVVTVVDDAIDDDDETIILNGAVAAATLTAAPATLTIADNDDASTPVVNTGCATPADGDYDSDDDGLIEVCNLEQLNAIHWDPDGDGLPHAYQASAYAIAFPNAASRMGCPQTRCNGYELTADLDFDTNGNGRADRYDKHMGPFGILRYGWRGLGREYGLFAAVFDGNGHVIRNLHINYANYNGLFGETTASAVIRNVGVEDVLLHSNWGHVGGLVGHNGGTIINSYTTGAVSGKNGVGGLVGGSDDTSRIIGSYSTATVTGSADDVGGLVGGNEGTIVASYATGNVTGVGNSDGNYVPGNDDGMGHAIGGLVGLNYEGQKIIASYATGAVSAPRGEKVGGLVGYNLGHITASYSTGAVSGRKNVSGLAYSDTTWVGGASTRVSYWDTATSGRTASAHGAGKTTAELQSPTGYTGIYTGWNVDLNGDGSADDPWDFGASCQYPVLKYGGLNPADQLSSCTPSPIVETAPHAALIVQIYQWREDPQWRHQKTHTDRWDRALLAFGETVSDTTLTAMTAAEAQALADQDWGERWVPVAAALREIEANRRQQGTPNRAPTVSAAIGDVTIVNRSGARQVSLSGVFADADADALTITAASSDEAVATVSVATDYSALTVSARARGAVTITVNANDGNGGTTEDAFTVTVKAAPVVASAIADVSSLAAGATQDVSLSGVFSDGDGDALTITASSSDETKATVTVASDGSKLTLGGVAEGTTTVTVTARDSDGNRVSDAFQVEVSAGGQYVALIAQMYQWREDPQWRHQKSHTDRWDRALLAFGETVSDTTLTAMTADEAQGLADSGLTRWVEVAQALREIEGGGQQTTPNQAPTVSAAISDATIVNASGTQTVSLSGVFSDADNDALTITAVSSDDAVATVSVASDQSSLTVTAKARGTAVITVNANDRRGGTVSDAFTVTVKAAPVVASAIADMSGLEAGSTQDVSLSGVFSDADGDALTITAASSDEAKATVSVSSDGSTLTLSGVAQGMATVTVTAQDADGNRVSDAFDVEVATRQRQEPTNQAPMVSAAIADATIVNESGAKQVSLSGVFADADNDPITITATSSDEAKATVSVASDGSSLTVTAKSRGTATITVTAEDGNGGTVDDAFTVKVKAAPDVASNIADVSGLEAEATREVSLAGVFSDADGDSLTISATSSNDAVATVSAASDGSSLTVAGVSEGTATITVTVQDSDGNRVADAFDVSVAKAPEPETSDIVARYDTDGDGKINASEYQQAFRDYIAGKITYEEMLEVSRAFDGSG